MKILYIFDREGWAVHKVGLLWFKDTPYDVTYKAYENVSDQDLKKYDLIWYGITGLFFKRPTDLKKSVITLQDPSEIFGQYKDWKNSNIPLSLNLLIWAHFFRRFISRYKRVELLKKAKMIVVTSQEMKNILQKKGINSELIRTTTEIEVLKSNKKIDNFSVITVCNKHIRKNIWMLKNIKKFCESMNIQMYIKLGLEMLSKKDYIKLLDSHSVYICTSFQEGGPLPAMDAMARGLVVLTTPVGQIQEMITKNNGYICNSFRDFKDKILYLKNNQEIWKKMSINSVNIIKKRSKKCIKQQVIKYIASIKI